MIGLIARRELLEFKRDGRLWWTGAIILLLLATAFAVSWSNQVKVAAERTSAQGLDYDDWLSQTRRHPHDAAHQGMHVFKPQPPLSILDPGIEPYVGSTIWLQAHRQSEMKFRPAQDATGLQRFGNLSAAWVVQVLGPLLVIVLGFNAFSGEREQGTLRQVLSLGISPRKLMWGKALALGWTLLLLLGPAALLGAVLVVARADQGTKLDTVARLLLMGLGYAIYIGIAVFVVMGVSAITKRARVALITLLALWIGSVVMLPRIISDVSRSVYPSETRLQFNGDLDADLSTSYKQAWMKNFGVSTRWGTELPLSRWGKALSVDDHAGFGVIDKHFNQLWDSFAHQQRMQEIAGFLSPAIALRAFSMGVAGTDFAQHRDFATAAERQRRVMQNLMSDDLVSHADNRGDHHFSYRAGPELWKTVPRFSYQSPRIGFAIAQNWPSFLILVAMLIASILFALLAVPRRHGS